MKVFGKNAKGYLATAAYSIDANLSFLFLIFSEQYNFSKQDNKSLNKI